MSSVIEKSLRATVLSLREELAREHKVAHELEDKLKTVERGNEYKDELIIHLLYYIKQCTSNEYIYTVDGNVIGKIEELLDEYL